MALSAPIITFPYSKLEPLFPGDANEIAINLVPNVSLVAGQVLEQATAHASDVQTLTLGGTPTGGTFPISGTNPYTGAAFTITNDYVAPTATVQTALRAIFGAANVNVTGTAGASYVITFVGGLANLPMLALTTSAASLTSGTTATAAFVHTTTGTSAGTYQAYASGTAKLLLSYSVATDLAGNHYFATSAASEWGQVYSSCPAYRNGTFRTGDLTGLNATSAGHLGRIINGDSTAGIIQLI